MARFAAYGGAIDAEGAGKFLAHLFRQGNSFGFAVTQRGTGANMSVDVSTGAGLHVTTANVPYYGWTTATENVSVNAADPANPRADVLVSYVDLASISTSVTNNAGAFKFLVVPGTPAASPADPTSSVIQAAVGAGNPYNKIARISVGTGATTVVTANVIDLKTPMAFAVPYLYGGGNNTKGHLVPNLSDDTVVLASAVQTLSNKTLVNPTITGASDWTALNTTFGSVTANGNRSYTIATGSDVSGVLTPGARLRTTRAVPAPTQSALLSGTSQYFSKSTPVGMTFTDDFAAGAWVKLTSYPSTEGAIISRNNGTSGWSLKVRSTGQIRLIGQNGAGNFSLIDSYQSIPLNKWVHVAVQLDMSSFTATPTTSYVMIDGVDTAAVVSRTGTNPISLVQAGNLEVGTENASLFFPGAIAQAFITSAKVSQANIRGIYSQGISGTDVTNLAIVSAFSLSNSLNDLNSTNANNLVAQSGASTTNPDSPFGSQANGAISSTLDYGIVQKVTSTAVAIQVAEGCTIPTNGGVAAVSFSTQRSPYGFPAQRNKWFIEMALKSDQTVSSAVSGTLYNINGLNMSIPLGEWRVSYKMYAYFQTSTATTWLEGTVSLSTTPALSSSNEPRSVSVLGTDRGSSSGATYLTLARDFPLSLGVATTYYLNMSQLNAVSASGIVQVRASTSYSWIEAENAYL